jgi:hypothetical protein
MVTQTERSDGTVIDVDGLAVPYKEYTSRYTKRKQDLLQNFDTKYNDPFLFRDDQLWVTSKTELQALPKQEEINNLMLERNRLEMRVSEHLAGISASPDIPFNQKITMGFAAIKDAPITEVQAVDARQRLVSNAVSASLQKFNLFVTTKKAEIATLYKEDSQGQAEALRDFPKTKEYREGLQEVYNNIDVGRSVDARLDAALMELKTKVRSGDVVATAELEQSAANYKVEAAQKFRAILLSETESVLQIAMTKADDPIVGEHISKLESTMKNATDAEKAVIQDELDFLKAGKQAFTGMNGSFLNIKVDNIKNVKLKAFVLRQQEVERNAIAAEAKARENGLSTAEDKLWDSLSENGNAQDAAVKRALAKGVSMERVNQLIQDTGAAPVDKERMIDAFINMPPKQAMQTLNLGVVQPNSNGERAVMGAASEAYGLNTTLTNAIFKSSSNMEQALAFSKAYGETGDRLSYKQDRDKASLIYNGEEIRIPSIPLQSNTMLLSNSQLYKMMASMEIEANPTKSLKELKPGIDKRVNAFLQGSVNKQKEESAGARTFNSSSIVPFQPYSTKNVNVAAGGSTNFSKQNAATVAMVRKVDKQFGAAGLRNTGLNVTSMFRANYKNKSFHKDSSMFAIDVQSTNPNPAVLGRQMHELFVAQANMSNGKPYQIMGHAGGQGGKLFELASIIRKSGTIPAEYAKNLSANQIRFMINHVRKATFMDEGAKADPHLHLSGQPDKTNTYKAYNNR